MRKQTLTLIYAGIMMLSPAFGKHIEFPKSTVNTKAQSDEIDLRGRIEPGEIRRSEIAISAFLETAVIISKFHFDIGVIQISIINQTGNIVYINTISSSIGEFSIPVSGLTSGNYSIIFKSLTGEITGDFALL